MKDTVMKRFIISAAITAALTLACAGQAQARIFEPQHNWWSSGRSCIASRNPPGLAWDDLPPRACVAREDVSYAKPSADEFTHLKQDGLVFANAETKQRGETSVKI